MTKKLASKKRQPASGEKRSPGRNVLLTLTLVPLVIGILLIGAWALDFLVLQDAQSQLIVGVLFFLISFAASNALQKRGMLAAGWGLLMCADLILLIWLNLWAQIAAIALSLVGLSLLAVEFYRQYKQGNSAKAAK